MTHVNSAHLQKYLKGVDYPATRERLIENAKNLGADDSVCASLELLPEQDFQTLAEVKHAFMDTPSDDAQGRAEEAARAYVGRTNGFLIQLVEDSLVEMEICMLARDRSPSDDVKAFAQTMLHEHGKLGQQLEKMAQSMQLSFPKKMRPENVKLVREMTQLEGAPFDERFADENVRYHENDLKVFAHYAGQEGDEAVRKLAGAGAKLFEKHLQLARDLQDKLKR